MKQERDDFLKDFNYYLKNRISTKILVVEIKIFRKHWENALTKKIVDNFITKGIDGAFGTNIVQQHKDDAWANLTKCVKAFEKRKRKSKRGYKAINNSRSHKYKKDFILIKLKGIPRKTDKTLKSGVEVQAGFPTPAWQTSAINALKKEIKKKVKSFDIVTAEHGSLPQEEQGKGQVSATMIGKRVNVDKKKGAVGNVVSNAIVQALMQAIEDDSKYIDLFGDYVRAFWSTQYESKVTKRKSLDKFVVNHTAKFVIIPDESLTNDGYYDKSDAMQFEKEYESSLKQYLREKLGPKAKERDINKAFAASPAMTDEFGNYAVAGATKKMLEKAGFRLTATGALDRRQKGITKSGGLDMRIKFNRELIASMKEAQAKTERSALKNRTKQQIRKQRKILQSATGVSISKKRAMGNNAQSPTLNTQALALKDILNMTLSEEILSRMQLPALRNRTGRFRDSAEVVNTFMGPRGGLTIDYTYMKYPYQTFEPGFKQGSTNRDPRRIIGASIREIVAANMKGMQPLIRRV